MDMRYARIVSVSVLVAAQCALSSPPATATATTAKAEKKPLVELREQGGFAGLDNRVTVYTNGCARATRRTGPAVTRCLSDGELRELRADLKRLRLGRSQAQPPGADFIKYTLRHKGRKATRYTLPTTWVPVVRRLQNIHRRATTGVSS
ncbi:hypothetical protein AB0K60_03405 [Thermopolyspora sp. NPDC052614]|uniref:hypothetical protein n=1 Tax=Thermopolyspora sp. NPDC052614 TaxID=3155682 RepID=UPI0034246DF5